MLIGDARVSTADQDLALQIDALTKAGCERLFTDKASGAKADRPGLAEALFRTCRRLHRGLETRSARPLDPGPHLPGGRPLGAKD